MRKYQVLILSLILFSSTSIAMTASTPNHSIKEIYLQKDRKESQERIIEYLKNKFLGTATNDNKVAVVTDSLKIYDAQNADILNLFINTLITRRTLKHTEARAYVLKAIILAQKKDQPYFLYILYNQLAYIQTDVGDAVGAMHNYRLAKKQATALNNRAYQANMDLNISDLYIKVEFYKQALICLDNAQAFYAKSNDEKEYIKFVYMNKVEAFFGLKQADSLQFYLDKLNKTSEKKHYLARARTRLNTYPLLLQHNYTKAIAITKQLLSENMPYDHNDNLWSLAESYFANHQPDLAKTIVLQLVSDSLKTPPRLKLQYYRLLAEIYKQENNYPDAYMNSELAFQQSEKYARNLVQLGDLSSQIKLEEKESSYEANTKTYQRERMMLLFGIVSLALVIVIVVLFYYNIRQKRKYEQLLYTSERQKLAHMNSHEVRRHLSNIMGLCIVLDETNVDTEELPEFYEYMLESARQMDDSLKNVEQRLSEND